MKRIERNTYNSIRKNTTEDTINVEVPVEYTHEARQAIHEYLTNKGMRVTGINWNSIQECYCIHWEPARTETADAIRKQQENTDIDEITANMEYSDWTWNGYRKPTQEPTEAQEAAQETEPEEQPTTATEATTEAAQPATDEEEKEEPTMKNAITATEAATVRAIIRRAGGYREKDLLNHSHTMTRSETWNAEHKVIEVLDAIPDPDGYCAGCAVDIVTRSIVG